MALEEVMELPVSQLALETPHFIYGFPTLFCQKASENVSAFCPQILFQKNGENIAGFKKRTSQICGQNADATGRTTAQWVQCKPTGTRKHVACHRCRNITSEGTCNAKHALRKRK